MAVANAPVLRSDNLGCTCRQRRPEQRWIWAVGEFMVDISGAQAHGWGLLPLLLGPLPAVTVAILLAWPSCHISTRWAVPVAWSAVIDGVACLAAMVPVLISIDRGPATIIGGLVITPKVGWGLWLTLTCGGTLCLAAGFVAERLARYVEELERHRRSGRLDQCVAGGSTDRDCRRRDRRRPVLVRQRPDRSPCKSRHVR